MSACQVCQNEPVFGGPSAARWLGPDGKAYCSMHFIGKFGHAETLVKIDSFEAPTKTQPPAAKKKAAAKGKAPKEVTA